MKNNKDLVKSWIKKADADMVAAQTLLECEIYDGVCFHSQQAVEKYIKAFLISKNKEFPFIHNLTKLVELCMEVDDSFECLKEIVHKLTPYATEVRYDPDFVPDEAAAQDAVNRAEQVIKFISKKMFTD